MRHPREGASWLDVCHVAYAGGILPKPPYPLDRGRGALSGPDRGAPLVRGEGRAALEAKDLRVSRLGAAGEYIVEVSVRAPEGDAAYYFRIVVV